MQLVNIQENTTHDSVQMIATPHNKQAMASNGVQT